MNIFGVMKILWIFFGSSQNWTFLCILWSFLKVRVQNGDIFGELQKFQIFLGVYSRCWVQTYAARKN